jgi:ankyrin repeat protein
LVVDCGADVNAADADGRTALTFAALQGHDAVVKLLTRLGAAVDAADAHGHTALMEAAHRGLAATATLLHASGANVDAVAKDGATAALFAAAQGHAATVAALAELGADVLAADLGGTTPALAAAEAGHAATVEVLGEASRARGWGAANNLEAVRSAVEAGSPHLFPQQWLPRLSAHARAELACWVASRQLDAAAVHAALYRAVQGGTLTSSSSLGTAAGCSLRGKVAHDGLPHVGLLIASFLVYDNPAARHLMRDLGNLLAASP